MAEALREERAAYEDVRALRFTLVDERGAVRAAFGPGRDGAIGMCLLDGDGRARAQLAVDASGAANLKLHDAEGEVCAWLDVGPDGRPGLYLRGATGHHEGVRGHAEVSVDERGCPVLSLHDRNGQPRVLMSLDDRSGSASLSFADARGNPCALLTEDADGGRLHLFERDGRTRGVPVLRIGPYAEDTASVPAEEPATEVAVPPSRRRGRTAGLVFAGALLGVVGGLFVPRPEIIPAPQPAPTAPTAPTGSTLRAEELVLTDHAGAVRARLTVLPDGTPLLWMTDPAGTSSAQLSVLPDSGAQLRLTGGRSAIALAAPPGEPPSLGAYAGSEVLFQAPSHVARFLPLDLWPPEEPSR